MEDVPDKKALGKRLQAVRKAGGFKNAASLAEKVGISKAQYVSYEQGQSRLSYEVAWKIADALGISLDELGGRDWPRGGAASLSSPERALLENYRLCGDSGRSTVDEVARLTALASGEALSPPDQIAQAS